MLEKGDITKMVVAALLSTLFVLVLLMAAVTG